MKIKDRIKALRKEKGYTQAQIAKGTSVDQSTVSYWEKGRQEPNAAQRKRLCDFLGITQSQLFEGVTE
ncbi:MAG: helix-turn-helix transcriptional regulator [Candidatus Omnitrophica bacterium]|nr:helix-turn-helix transcriptional regulator [Candidatus Omnitrophota bacterium]